MSSYQSVMTEVGVEVPVHLVAQAEVPVLSGPQRQGDLLVVPAGDRWSGVAMRPVGAGIPVVRGEATGNTHILAGDAGVLWSETVDAGQVIGVVYVPQGATAWLIHTDEHGANGIGTGWFEIRGKREQADEIRAVAD
jgi:hypothetical protein